MAIATELPINTSATALEMAQAIFGDGVVIDTNNVSYSGAAGSSGIYEDADATMPNGVAPSDTGVIISTGQVTDFTNSDGSTDTNTAAGTSTDNNFNDGIADFNALAGGANTFDAAYLDVTFTPVGNTLTLDFVIASEEYPEYINSQFNDVVGVWVNGAQAALSVGDGSGSIGNINGSNTANLYNDNTSDQYNTEMDGFTVTLSYTIPVNPGVPNTIRIGVADVADGAYDTNLLIAANSAQTAVIAEDDTFQLGANVTKTVDVLANDSGAGTLTITHVNGDPVVANVPFTLPTGQEITLTNDGKFLVTGDSDVETVWFDYTIQDANGGTDTGLVQFDQVVPCFTTGTLIETPDGPVRVERMRPGDLVNTLDAGPQTLLWLCMRRVVSEGHMRPIRIAAGRFGATADLVVSPQHQVLVTGPEALLLFGEDEVLVRAKHLVYCDTVTIVVDLGFVSYFHLLFDDHHIVTSNGALTESYHLGEHTYLGMDVAARAELTELFPSLLEDTMPDIPSARLSLNSREAMVLSAAIA